jgi:RNA polymerase sigma factor (sigma-70 family)
VDPTDDEGVERGDGVLLAAVRAGDEAAYAELWTRHSSAARRLAATFVQPANVDDLVSESYYRVLRAVRAGGGPQDAFRPYLFSTMRRLAIDTARSYEQRVTLTDEPADLETEPVSSAADVAAISAEQRAAWRAWASLPDASRTVLWHLLVEEQTPATVAPILGTSPNGVALRAGRAKERLRQAFLQQHLAAADRAECRETRSRLGAYVRDALSARDRAAVDEHLQHCDRCRAALLEIVDVNRTLRTVIAPLILGGAVVAHEYLPAASAAAAGGAGSVAAGQPPSRPRSSQVKTIAAAAATIAALITAVLVILAVTHGPNGSGRNGAAAPASVSPGTTAPSGPAASGSGRPTARSSVPNRATGPNGTGRANPGAPGSGQVAASPGAGRTPAGGPPAAGQPAGGQPAGGQPAGGQPAGGQPAGGQPAGGGPAATAPAGGPPAATTAAAPPPAPAPPPPTRTTETVSVTVPNPAASVSLSVPAGWTIQAVTAAGIAVNGCTGLNTTTVRCLQVGVGTTIGVRVSGIRTSAAYLHAVTVGLGGRTHDYPL